MKSYTLTPFGRGDHAAVLCALCAYGKIGEALLREGFTKKRWNEFVLALVLSRQAKKLANSVIIDALCAIDAGNASASRQALGSCTLIGSALDKPSIDEAGKPTTIGVSVEKYWSSIGGPKSKPDMACIAD